MDHLSRFLDQVRLRNLVFVRGQLTAPWGVSHPAVSGAAYQILSEGRCLFRAAGDQRTYRLRAGDFVFMPQGAAHTLQDAPGTPIISLADLGPAGEPDETGWVEAGDDTGRASSTMTFACGFVELDPALGPLIFGALPPVILLRRSAGGERRMPARMRGLLDLLAVEVASRHPGSDAVIQRLADVAITYLLRELVLVSRPGLVAGAWFEALRRPALARALGEMHRAPTDDWTLEGLANLAGMSLSAFKAAFASSVGETPARYLTRLRLTLAAEELRLTDYTVSAIAATYGYEDEAAFGKAFKRYYGVGPGAYRRDRYKLLDPRSCRVSH